MRALPLVYFLLPLLLLAGCDREPVPRGDAPTWEYVDRADVTVTVQAEGGATIAGAWVTLLPGGRDGVTGSDGTVRLPGVGEGSFDLLVDADGFHALEQALTVPADGASATVTLSPVDVGGTLFGTVTGPDGQPVADATVWVGADQVATTGGDGTFTAVGLDTGLRSVEVRGPDGSSLVSWRSEGIELIAAGQTEVDVGLAGHGEGASYVGSTACSFCHAEAHDAWAGTPHAQAGRVPDDMLDDPTGIDEAFEQGRVVSLDPAVPGAFVTLGSDGPGDWTVQVTDGSGTTTGVLPVSEVYGGHRFGAAFAVEIGGTRSVVPAGWAAAGQGLGEEQFEPGFVPAFTEGWFDSNGDLALDAGQPGDAASFALQCAGCHATGYGLEEDDGFSLVSTDSARESRVVGCEACHGPGQAHVGSRSPKDILNPARLHASQRLDTCARCHERVEPDDHPFSTTPAWPVDGAGDPIGAHERIYDVATPDPSWWVEVPASKVLGDHVGELRASPHRQGPSGYDGSCEDCHDPHGSSEVAQLRTSPSDNELCTSCHRSRFPSYAAEKAHARHDTFVETRWGVGTCTHCHMGRSGKVVRLDAVSGVGELHSHSLTVWRPEAVLAEFDAAGTDELPVGDVPVSTCLDCHLQWQARLETCACPIGDPGERITYENLATVFDRWWGAP